MSLGSPAFVVSGPPAAAVVFGPPRGARAGIGAAPARVRPVAVPAARKPRPAIDRSSGHVDRSIVHLFTQRANRPASRAAQRPARKAVRKVVRKAPAARRGLSAVVAFALSKVGARYGSGPGRYDCSRLTQAAYASAGIRLPRTSGAQRARARVVSWSAARSGDLIVGRGHVGIYVGKRGGRHMMVDAGNPRVGVSYRAVYVNSQGLRPARVG